jgi:hypothetical protein
MKHNSSLFPPSSPDLRQYDKPQRYNSPTKPYKHCVGTSSRLSLHAGEYCWDGRLRQGSWRPGMKRKDKAVAKEMVYGSWLGGRRLQASGERLLERNTGPSLRREGRRPSLWSRRGRPGGCYGGARDGRRAGCLGVGREA